MPAPLLEIELHSDRPDHADCVVIGGGIFGICTAYWLARAEPRVIPLEKAASAPEDSLV
tara:strand:+ start:289 stop:465 length:177 start_codon:yes stop_codon:yes gene_type:complete